MVFPVVMYGCESWTVKNAERQRIDAFELWCWRRLLRVPCTARRSKQSILKEISPGCSLEGLMLKLKLQYFGHLMRRVDSLEKALMLGGTGGRRRRGWQRIRWLDGITDLMDMNLSDSGCWQWTGRPGVLCFMWSQRVGHNWVTELNWTERLRNEFSTNYQFLTRVYYSLPEVSVIANSCGFYRLCNINRLCQPPLSTGFSKQEYWSGLPFPPSGDLPYPGNEPRSPAL